MITIKNAIKALFGFKKPLVQPQIEAEFAPLSEQQYNEEQARRAIVKLAKISLDKLLTLDVESEEYDKHYSMLLGYDALKKQFEKIGAGNGTK